MSLLKSLTVISSFIDLYPQMVMEAIAASLQDVEIKETEQKEPAEVGSPTSEDTAAATRVDSFTQRMRLSFFRGMGSRRSASR